MADSLLIVLAVGTLLGSLSGLGIGGGSLLLLWLTMAVGTDPETARVMNLMFFVPSALISTWLRRKQSLAPKSLVVTAAAAGVGGAILGNWLSLYIIEETLLRKGLGVLFLVSGIREICYRERKLR